MSLFPPSVLASHLAACFVSWPNGLCQILNLPFLGELFHSIWVTFNPADLRVRDIATLFLSCYCFFPSSANMHCRVSSLVTFEWSLSSSFVMLAWSHDLKCRRPLLVLPLWSFPVECVDHECILYRIRAPVRDHALCCPLRPSLAMFLWNVVDWTAKEA